MKKQKKHTGLIITLSIAAAMAIGVVVYSHFGGFGTGDCADTEEFSKYAVAVSDITIPEQTQIVALGEATHGNREFQQLRLGVFQVLVEKYGVRAFALEGDFGGCEAINRYIHGGDGTAMEALSATGFAIYRTEEMENLVEWMRNYNASAAEGDDLRFYGFDMQRRAYNYRYLLEAMQEHNIGTTELELIWDREKGTYSDTYGVEERTAIIGAAKEALPQDDAQAVHFADILLQNLELGKYINDTGELNAHRDRMMAENTLWILQQEQARGNSRIMISGHNSHVMQCKSGDLPVMGSLLAETLSDGYFTIGTDFYRSDCNLPKPYTGERITHTFYSYDPLAKASQKSGFDVSFLDFSNVPDSSTLAGCLSGKIWTGSLGESYSTLMNFIPRSYRVLRTPKEAYDAMIFVANATPIEIRPSAE